MSNLTCWLLIGFLGQALFTSRFLVQWLVSEREHESVMPVAFWWLSLMGGTALLCYAVFRNDPVIIVGQAMGLVVYVRNLMLVRTAKKRVIDHGHSLLQHPHSTWPRREQFLAREGNASFQADQILPINPVCQGFHDVNHI